jgi:uncharacterized protein (TIGR02246 family)
MAAAIAFAQGQPGKEPRGRGIRDLPPARDPRITGAAEIRAAVADWQKAIDARDFEKCAALYAPDASIFPPGAPVITSAEARHDFWKQFLADAAVKIRLETWRIEVARSGEIGYETGAFSATSKDAKGRVLSSKGKNVVVWKKQTDGTWKIVADIFNADK